MRFNSPISPEKADRIIGLLGVSSEDHVLDAGCGRGEFLLRVVKATGARGLGIDVDPGLITDSRQQAADRIPDGSCEFRAADLQREALPDGTFDLAICLGSTHAFGAGDAAYPNTLKTLSRVLRPGGRMLIGEGYWKQPPAAEYLKFIGDPVGIYRDHAGNIAFAELQGLVTLYAAVSSDDEWDHFEWSHAMRIERDAALHPEDPRMRQKFKRSREWLQAYLRWGRSTMGFGFYLFSKPGR